MRILQALLVLITLVAFATPVFACGGHAQDDVEETAAMSTQEQEEAPSATEEADEEADEEAEESDDPALES